MSICINCKMTVPRSSALICPFCRLDPFMRGRTPNTTSSSSGQGEGFLFWLFFWFIVASIFTFITGHNYGNWPGVIMWLVDTIRESFTETGRL